MYLTVRQEECNVPARSPQWRDHPRAASGTRTLEQQVAIAVGAEALLQAAGLAVDALSLYVSGTNAVTARSGVAE
jgi:hypothetical protein